MANGDKSKYFLNVISTLCAVLLALMAWTFNSAMQRNDTDHTMIMERQELAVQEVKSDIKDLAKQFNRHARREHE